MAPRAVFHYDSYVKMTPGQWEANWVFDLQPPIKVGDGTLDRLRFERTVTELPDYSNVREFVSGRGEHNGRFTRHIQYEPELIDEIMLRFKQTRQYDLGLPDHPYKVSILPKELRRMLEESGRR